MSRLGTCEKCGHDLEMHYVEFCPKCDINVLEIKGIRVFDLFKIMYHMEANGFMSKSDFWEKHILGNYNVSNDIFVNMYFDNDSHNEQYNAYMEELSKILNVPLGESVIMLISW